jgi:hypothetical protein
VLDENSGLASGLYFSTDSSDSGQGDIQERHYWNQLFAAQRTEGFVGRWTECRIKPNPLVQDKRTVVRTSNVWVTGRQIRTI